MKKELPKFESDEWETVPFATYWPDIELQRIIVDDNLDGRIFIQIEWPYGGNHAFMALPRGWLLIRSKKDAGIE